MSKTKKPQPIRIFPNDASALRIVVSLAIEQNEEWIAGKIYLDMSLLDSLELDASIKSKSDTKVPQLDPKQKEVNLASSTLISR